MDVPNLLNLNLDSKRVILRADLDTETDPEKNDRLKNIIPTLNYLATKSSKTIIIGHKGRPGGITIPEFSLRSVASTIGGYIDKPVDFYQEISDLENIFSDSNSNVILLENLRFFKGEEENDEDFAGLLSRYADIYINDAFASSHRYHASIISLPKIMKRQEKRVGIGFRMEDEIKNLRHVLVDPQRPLVVLINGVKEDKLKYIEGFIELADKVLIGGRLPEYLPSDYRNEKVLIACLTESKEDIDLASIENFEAEIAKAKTIIVSGPVGKFEIETQRLGTQRIYQKVSQSQAFKVAGGGDTQKALGLLGLESSFNWISSGGGAMLEFLTKGTLPGIEALQL